MSLFAIAEIIRDIYSQFRIAIRRAQCLKDKNNVRVSFAADLLNVKFEEYAFVAHHVQIQDSYVGNHTSVGRYTKIRETDIGKYCSISWDSTIGAPAHPMTTISTAALTYCKEYNLVEQDMPHIQKRTIIENDVWVGCNVVVIAGVKIGNGAVIGGGAVVTKDVAPYSIVAGTPAKCIGHRVNSKLLTERIQNLQWWEWDEECLRNCVDFFKADISEELVSNMEKYKERMNI